MISKQLIKREWCLLRLTPASCYTLKFGTLKSWPKLKWRWKFWSYINMNHSHFLTLNEFNYSHFLTLNELNYSHFLADAEWIAAIDFLTLNEVHLFPDTNELQPFPDNQWIKLQPFPDTEWIATTDVLKLNELYVPISRHWWTAAISWHWVN